MSPSKQSLEDGARIGVIGGGPAGAFFSIFVLDLAFRLGIEIFVDIYEPRDFRAPGPPGCNMCGGIISETLVQNLASEGILLPPTIIQRAIDSYVLHMDVGRVKIQTPTKERRIGAVHRGAGPKDLKEGKWGSFDGLLLEIAIEKGARVVQERVAKISFGAGLPSIHLRAGDRETYDVVAVAVGVNAGMQKLFRDADLDYELPETSKTYIREYYLGEQKIESTLGSSMHVFLLDIPRLEFAALVPKGDYISMAILGEDIDNELIQNFLSTPVTMRAFPPTVVMDQFSCNCSPRINVKGAARPYKDRMVFIGDCGVTRLYKDGIGAAYKTAKAAATTVILEGVSEADFERSFAPICDEIESDNRLGKIIFRIAEQVQKSQGVRRAILRSTVWEQADTSRAPIMSTILWDMFTGSSSYRDIVSRAIQPGFLLRFFIDLVVSFFQELVEFFERSRAQEAKT